MAEDKKESKKRRREEKGDSSTQESGGSKKQRKITKEQKTDRNGAASFLSAKSTTIDPKLSTLFTSSVSLPISMLMCLA